MNSAGQTVIDVHEYGYKLCKYTKNVKDQFLLYFTFWFIVHNVL